MKYLCIVAIATTTLFSISTQTFAQQAVDKTIAAEADGNITIEHVSGQAKIIGWERNEVQVVGTLGERTEDFQFERNGNSIDIIVKVKKQYGKGWNNWSNSDGDDLTINVPKQSKVTYITTNTDVQIKNIHGGLSAEVVNGDLNVDEISGRVRLESVNGDISARNIAGELSAETVNGDVEGEQTQAQQLSLSTVNGDIELKSTSPDVTAETVNGDITLDLNKVSELSLNTVNGSLQVSMELLPDGLVEASSVGGEIDLRFQKGVAAKFDVEAHAGGSIKNRITDAEQQKAKYGPRRWLNFATPNPNASVEVSTVHGRVKLSTK